MSDRGCKVPLTHDKGTDTMDNREYPKVRREAEPQGWRVVPKRSGEMWLGPDGVTQVMWHFTPSDHRALDNFVTKLRRGGFTWPPPRKGK